MVKECFPDEESLLRFIFDCRSSELSKCDHCGSFTKLYRTKGTKRYSGYCCGDVYRTVTKGTIFFRSTLPFSTWLIAALYFANSKSGVTTAFIGAMLGIGKDTSFKVSDRIRSHMALLESNRTIGGENRPVAVTFRLIRRTHDRGPPGGRGTLVMALFDDLHSVAVVVPNRRIQTITPIILAKVRPGSVLLYADDCEKRRLLGYGYHKRLSRTFRIESASTHPAPYNLGISYWSNLLRVFRATYGRARNENIWKYVGEYDFRFNRRHCDHEAFWDIIRTPSSII